MRERDEGENGFLGFFEILYSLGLSGPKWIRPKRLKWVGKWASGLGLGLFSNPGVNAWVGCVSIYWSKKRKMNAYQGNFFYFFP